MVGLSVTGFGVGCFVGRDVTGFGVGCAVGLSVTGFGVGRFVGSGVAGTTKCELKGATGFFEGVTVGAFVDGVIVGLEVGVNTMPAFQDKSDSPDSRIMPSVRPVEGTVKLYCSLSAN